MIPRYTGSPCSFHPCGASVDLTLLLQAIAKTENIAVLVLIVVCGFLCRAIVIIRREDRADREQQEARAIAAQTRNNAVLDKLAEALVEMRITLASRGRHDDRT